MGIRCARNLWNLYCVVLFVRASDAITSSTAIEHQILTLSTLLSSSISIKGLGLTLYRQRSIGKEPHFLVSIIFCPFLLLLARFDASHDVECVTYYTSNRAPNVFIEHNFQSKVRVSVYHQKVSVGTMVNVSILFPLWWRHDVNAFSAFYWLCDRGTR